LINFTGAEILAKSGDASIIIDDHYYDHAGSSWARREDQDEITDRISKILIRHPHLVTDLGYSWASDSGAYRTTLDMRLQGQALELLADVNPRHPHILRAKPVAARLAISRDLVSYAYPTANLNFIFVGLGFIDMLKSFIALTLDLGELSERSKSHRFGLWGPSDLDQIWRTNRMHVVNLAEEFISRISLIVDEEVPPASPELAHRLLDSGCEGLISTYDSVELFIVAHELAHLLGEDDLQDGSVEKEIIADKMGTSLLFARTGAEKASGEDRAIQAVSSIMIGGPAFYFLSALFYLISAVMASARDESIERQSKSISQVRRRWLYYLKTLTEFGTSINPVMQVSKEILQVADLVYFYLHAFSIANNLKNHGGPIAFADKYFYRKLWS
jgi:hypothetical protein